jgi:hypothetical protein
MGHFSRVPKYPGEFFRIDPTKWWINSSATTSKDLSDQLGITTDPATPLAATGIVVSVKGYFGRGPSDMWEWVAAKISSPKPNV